MDTYEKLLSPELLSFWVKEPYTRKRYVAAFKRSCIEGMLNYYRTTRENRTRTIKPSRR